MAQVKKFQVGGSFKMNGRELSGQEALDKLTPLLGATTGGISTAIQQGKIVDYNPADNTIFITDESGEDLTLKYLPALEDMSPRDSTFKRRWRATFNTEKHQAALDLERLRRVNMIGTAAQEAKDLTDLRRGSDWFEFTTNEDGTKTFLENHQGNADKLSIIDLIAAYHNSSDEDKKKYNTSKWTKSQLDEFGNFYKTITDKDAYWKGLKDRIRSNNLDKSDIYTLKSFGFNPDGSAPNEDVVVNRGKWNKAGFGDLYDLLGDKAYIDDNGAIALNPGQSWGWNLGDLNNVWFNDDFYNSSYGVDGSFEPYRNLTLYNDRLYSLDNPTLAKILNVEGGFNEMMRSGNWAEADKIIRTRFSKSALENPSVLNTDQYSDFLSKNPNYRFSDLTGLVTIPGMESNDQIIQYVDLADNSMVGPYRQYQYKFALLDPRGTKLRDLSKEELVDVENGQTRDTGLITYKKISGNPNKLYNGRYYEDITDNAHADTGFRFYRSIDDPDGDVILHIPHLVGRGFISKPHIEDKDIKLPPELAKVLMSNTKWLDNVLGDTRNKKNFQEILSWITTMGRGTAYVWLERDLKKLGFSDEEIKVFKNARKGSKYERQGKYLVTSPTLRKEGGLLKYQRGGKAGGSKVATGVTERQINTETTNPQNAAFIGDIGSKNWSKADDLELTALGADLLSFISAVAPVPGGNIASAAIGAGASTARLSADIERGTKGAGWNYLLNLGMDAATLLPIIGEGTRGFRVVNSVKKALPTIIKAASVYGLGSAVVTSAQKIASGDRWTVRDVSNVVNGLTASVGLSKQGGLGKSTKTTKTKNYSETFKVGDTEVTLDNDQITDIMRSPDQAKALKDVISQKAKNASKEEINAALDKLLKPKQTIWQRVRRKKGDVVLDVKGKNNTSVTQLEAIEGRPLYNWWHKLGDNRAAYNARIIGDKRAWGKSSLIKTPGGQKSTQTYWDGKTWHIAKQSTKEVPIAGTESFSSNWATGSGPIWPTQQITRTTLNPTMSTRTITRKGGVRLDKNKYNLYNSQRIVLPQWINPYTRANYQLNFDQQPSGVIYEPSYKNGGKIIKAQSGSATDWWKKFLASEEGQKWASGKNKLEPEPEWIQPAVITAELDPTKQKVIDTKAPQVPAEKPQQPQQPQVERHPYGTLPGEKAEFNLPNIDDTLRAGVAARYIMHDTNLQRAALGELYKRQFQTPQYDLARYNYSDLEQDFNESAKPYLDARFVTSDPRDSMGFKLSKAQQLSALTGQHYAQLSQRKNQIDDLNRQISGQNELARVQTANEKSQYLTGLRYQDKMLNSTRLNRLWSDVIGPFGQQMSQQGRDAWNEIADAEYKEQVTKAKDDYNNAVAQLPEVVTLKQQYVADEKSKTISFEDWLELDPARLKIYNDAVTNSGLAAVYQEAVRKATKSRSQKRGAGSGVQSLWMKSGGTVNIRTTNKNQRPVEEQIAINSAKAAKRSVDELSKALLKMLAQLTK